MRSNTNRILLSHALTGFVLWYSIEKAFQQSLGFTTLGISVIAMIYIGISAVCNVPTGIISDKYGRKIVLLLAGMMLLLSSVLGASAYSQPLYVVSIILWGLFYTTQNGAYESILYDSLKAEGRAAAYARYRGLLGAVMWSMVGLGSVVGAAAASQYGLRSAFWLSVIPNVLNLLVVLSLSEPPREHGIKRESPLAMARRSRDVLLGSRSTVMIAAAFLYIAILGWTMNEFIQLFFIQLGFGVFLVGVLNGASAVAQAGGSWLGHRANRLSEVSGLVLLTALFVVTFILPTNLRWLGAIGFLLAMFTLNVVLVRNDSDLQHQLPSSIRNTAISTLGIFNDVLVLSSFVLFGIVGQVAGAKAGFLAVGLYGVVLLATAVVFARLRSFPEYRATPGKAVATTEAELPPR